jgi:hypothetical protein
MPAVFGRQDPEPGMAGSLRRILGRDVVRIPGREPDDVEVEVCGRFLRTVWLLHHDVLDSVVPECEDTATEVRE